MQPHRPATRQAAAFPWPELRVGRAGCAQRRVGAGSALQLLLLRKRYEVLARGRRRQQCGAGRRRELRRLHLRHPVVEVHPGKRWATHSHAHRHKTRKSQSMGMAFRYITNRHGRKSSVEGALGFQEEGRSRKECTGNYERSARGKHMAARPAHVRTWHLRSYYSESHSWSCDATILATCPLPAPEVGAVSVLLIRDLQPVLAAQKQLRVRVAA